MRERGEKKEGPGMPQMDKRLEWEESQIGVWSQRVCVSMMIMMMTKTTAPITPKMIIFYQGEKNKGQSLSTI